MEEEVEKQEIVKEFFSEEGPKLELEDLEDEKTIKK